jgi:DoxX-like family
MRFTGTSSGESGIVQAGSEGGKTSETMSLMPPPWLVRSAIALVWLYEGLWCKLLGRRPSQQRIVEAVPFLGPAWAPGFLKALGLVECGLGLWVLSGWEPVWAAATQTVLLLAMNANGLIFARRFIHDPAEMVVKNAALIVLMWVAAAQGNR